MGEATSATVTIGTAATTTIVTIAVIRIVTTPTTLAIIPIATNVEVVVSMATEVITAETRVGVERRRAGLSITWCSQADILEPSVFDDVLLCYVRSTVFIIANRSQSSSTCGSVRMNIKTTQCHTQSRPLSDVINQSRALIPRGAVTRTCTGTLRCSTRTSRGLRPL